MRYNESDVQSVACGSMRSRSRRGKAEKLWSRAGHMGPGCPVKEIATQHTETNRRYPRALFLGFNSAEAHVQGIMFGD